MSRSIRHLNEAPQLSSARDGAPHGPEPYRLKRPIDLCLAVPFLLFAMPLLALASVAILVESGRPILFKARRLGRSGRPFTLYKLRTMIPDADSLVEVIAGNNVGEGMVKIVDDPRVTRVGRLLRRFSVDELPQLWNVVRGEMSIVGPRPHDAAEVMMGTPETIERTCVAPGLTGLWQIRARSDPSLATRIYWDLRYVASCSLSLDLRIVLETIPAVLGGLGGSVQAPGSLGPTAAAAGPLPAVSTYPRRITVERWPADSESTTWPIRLRDKAATPASQEGGQSQGAIGNC